MTEMGERVFKSVTANRFRLSFIGAAVVLGLAACSGTDRPQDTFDPQGPQADKIFRLAVPFFLIAVLVGIAVGVGLIFILVKFRVRRGDDDRPEPKQIHGANKLEWTWTAAPAALLFVMAIFTVGTLFTLSEEPANAITVDVYGQQWWWAYEYDLDDNGTPEIITANDLVIPAGQSIRLRLHSRDVIHSFWIPKLAGTRDVVPGRIHTMVLKADKPGVYDGQCKEFCGLSHANMRARAVALPEDEFDTWLEQQQRDARQPTSALAQAGLATFEAKCASCHQINGVNEVEGNASLVSKHAPNLTHLMSRGVFASAMFPLYDENGNVNVNQLEAWLRDPPGVLPMAPPTRGMPNLNLSEEEIDQLIAYLSTLGPEAPELAKSAEVR